ncbi:MAG: biotin transporter BioY [Treponema sp.]|nr:biotin transporter BioY [Treponema sp.]
MGITLTSLFAALTAAGAFITIPLYPVAIVLQNFFTLLTGLVLGPLLGGAAMGLFLVAGALGAPVFPGTIGGIVRLFGPGGGFILSYPLEAIAAGLIAGSPRGGDRTPSWRLILAAIVGTVALYPLGLIRLRAVLQPEALGTLAAKFLAGDDNLKFIPLSLRAVFRNMDPSWLGTLTAGVFPFIIGDTIKAVAAVLIAPRLRRVVGDRLDRSDRR